MKKNPAAIALGKIGGAAKSERKAAASRENGKKGGRPRKHQPKYTCLCMTADDSARFGANTLREIDVGIRRNRESMKITSRQNCVFAYTAKRTSDGKVVREGGWI